MDLPARVLLFVTHFCLFIHSFVVVCVCVRVNIATLYCNVLQNLCDCNLKAWIFIKSCILLMHNILVILLNKLFDVSVFHSLSSVKSPKCSSMFGVHYTPPLSHPVHLKLFFSINVQTHSTIKQLTINRPTAQHRHLIIL